MSEAIVWGPVLSGPFSCKPEWLDDDEYIDVDWGSGWHSNDFPKGSQADCVAGWLDVRRIRRRADRFVFNGKNTTGDKGIKLETPSETPSDYEMRCTAVSLSGGDLTLAKAIFAFIKGDDE